MIFTLNHSGLLAFQTAVDDLLVAHAKAGNDGDPKSNTATMNRSTLLLRDMRAREMKHGHDLETLVPLLSNASKTLNGDCSETVKVITSWFQDCNSARWTWLFSKPSPEKIQQRQQGLVDQLNVIKKSLDHFRNVERVQLIKPFEQFFDPVTGRPLASVEENAGNSGFSVRCVVTRRAWMLCSCSSILIGVFVTLKGRCSYVSCSVILWRPLRIP